MIRARAMEARAATIQYTRPRAGFLTRRKPRFYAAFAWRAGMILQLRTMKSFRNHMKLDSIPVFGVEPTSYFSPQQTKSQA